MLSLTLALLVQVPDSSLSVRFIGNEAFVITDGRSTIVTDFPYRSGAFGYMAYERPAPFPGKVLALITHRHLDHFDPSEWRDSSWSILGPREVTEALSIGHRRALDSVVTFGSFVIRPIRTPHSDTEHYSYLIDWGTLRLFLSGDTEDPASLLAAEGVTHAFLTPWLWTTLVRGAHRPRGWEVIIQHHTAGQRPPSCEGCWLPRQNESRVLTAPAVSAD
jgi:L-ascorbate metabolism protein UlaG (beta-lactamase superfamily)